MKEGLWVVSLRGTVSASQLPGKCFHLGDNALASYPQISEETDSALVFTNLVYTGNFIKDIHARMSKI